MLYTDRRFADYLTTLHQLQRLFSLELCELLRSANFNSLWREPSWYIRSSNPLSLNKNEEFKFKSNNDRIICIVQPDMEMQEALSRSLLGYNPVESS